MENFLNELNDIQYKCITETEGPQLILAGAGSGKTRVVTTKIAYLVKYEKVNPQEILAFTFTNKAAKEMKDRVSKLLESDVEKMWIGTFHSMCVRILRRDLNFPNYTKNFSIFDTTDQKTLIKECIRELNLDEKIYTPNYVQNKISSMKNEGITPLEFEKFAFSPIDKKLVELYKMYERKMQSNNAFDFDDLIIKVIELFTNDSMIKTYYQQRFRYVFVDEYQDTNNVQYQLIKLISGMHNNICVVGDADQSIYKWRGANINNILNFEKDYNNTNQIILSQNYRSTQSILEIANSVIQNNTERIKKDLWTSNEVGDKPTLYEAGNSTEEAIQVANVIEKIINEGEKPSEIAILYRSNYISREFEEQLIKRDINYKVIGGIKFYDRAEIKDILGYLRLIVNEDDDVSFRRVVNSPKRGIGDVTVDKLSEIATEKNISLYKALEYVEDYDKLFDARAQKNLSNFKNLIDNLKIKSLSNSITELLEFLLERVEYISGLEKIDTLEARSKIENIEEFLSSVKNFEDNEEGTLHEFLVGVSLLSDVDKTENIEEAVSLITVHSAKGLEFKHVFIVALEEGVFPSSYAELDEDIEEERRLMYVALTRAKNNLYLSYAKSRMRHGKINYQLPSSFIEEMDENF
ncbi:MAG: UvrD-helicase domain-containing protein, partial [Tissierellia bacterium]|nr:UvrD-helicase domain-containing protein [Tissierellia bacterium]